MRKHKKKKISIGRHKTIKIKSLRNYNKDIYENILHNTNWDLIYSKTDANDAWTTFKTIITEIMDEVAPMKEVRIKNRTDPWINNELLHHIEHRINLLRQLT